MTDTLKQRILSIDPYKPYVWKLKLTEDDYRQLAQHVNQAPSAITKEYAILAIAYIAEWYKREYDGNVSNPLLGVSAENLWQISGFNSNTYVYRAKKTLRHLESIYMLGGLPMKFILLRNDRNLLKALCRLYKGDNETLEDNSTLGNGQAVAFKESIINHASIYSFMRTLLLSQTNDIFSEADLRDKYSISNQFIEAVKTAYDEVMHDKFKLEWIVEYTPDSLCMQRMLCLHLRSEELGGSKQYLRFERASTWGIPDLLRQRQLRISLRFKRGSYNVGDCATQRTLIYFENTGQDNTGFEAAGEVPWAVLRSIPTEPFDSIDIILTDDNNKSYVIQHIKCVAEYMQLWAMPGEYNRWSSMRSNQSETAVVFSDYYSLIDSDYETKPFFDKTNGMSNPYHFAFIPDHVILKHIGKPDITLWNRNGYIQFTTRLYSNVLMYNNGKVRYLYNEDPDVYIEPETEEWYPAIFCKDDIKVLHFKTKERIDESPDEIHLQRIEYKPFDAPSSDLYTEWTETNKPSYGRIKLRLTIKNDEKVYTVLYLPSLVNKGYDSPIVRDYINGKLAYADSNDNVIQIQIRILLNKKTLPVTVPITPWKSENEKVVLDVIQPTLIKEVYLDGQITKYLRDGEEFVLPYLLSNRVEIHDFNKEGFKEFKCFNVGGLLERGSLDRWECGDDIKTEPLTNDLPSYLKVRFGSVNSNIIHSRMLYWEYIVDEEPKYVESDKEIRMGDYSILFQDMRKVNSDLICLPPKTRNNQTVGIMDFGDWNAFMEPSNAEITVDEKKLKCFDMAIKYQTYFFIFNPLFTLTEEQFLTEICKPLRLRNDGMLGQEDVLNLMRCASELGFKWERLQPYI